MLEKKSIASEDVHSQVQKLNQCIHKNPHGLLGLHKDEDGQVIRLWRPGAEKVFIEIQNEVVEAIKIHASGLFEAHCDMSVTALDYRVYYPNGLLEHDPFSFAVAISEDCIQKFMEGENESLSKVMGGRLITHQGCQGARFCVWAPKAQGVSIICDSNYNDTRMFPMRNAHGSGVWEIFLPGIEEGEKYSFQLKTEKGEKVKTDPFAYQYELRPNQGAILYDMDHFQWEDDAWMATRKQQSFDRSPLNIYELHLGSWKKKNKAFSSYQALAKEIVEYCQKLNYTHVEILPLNEHPLDESWGYQVTGYFAATSRYGSPDDLKAFINHLHANDIGVIIDWVPGHFPKDEFALVKFDGTELFEKPNIGEHPHWNTLYFDYSKPQVQNFLLSSARLWAEEYHVDGIRVDAVASMIHLDFGKNKGEWTPNEFGGKEDLDAIKFLKRFTCYMKKNFPELLLIAEDTSMYEGITHDIEKGGLGFDLKWNVGWNTDMFKFFKTLAKHRHHEYNDLLLPFEYAFFERYVLPISHDEVKPQELHILEKMPGTVEEKLSNLRAFYTLHACFPGKSLHFMGCEIAQDDEWNSSAELPWNLLNSKPHHYFQSFMQSLNHFYLNNSALWERDFSSKGFEWVDRQKAKDCVIAFKRKSDSQTLLAVFNLGGQDLEDYSIPGTEELILKQVFSSEDEKYGGRGVCHVMINDQYSEKTLEIPRLSCVIYEVEN